MIGSSYFDYPWMFAILVLAWVGLYWFIFLKGKSLAKSDSTAQLRARVSKNRRLIFAMHCIVLLFLFAALASPFRISSRTVQGDPRVSILLDTSESMSVFDMDAVSALEQQLKSQIPTSVMMITQKDHSAIGDGLFANMKGNDNILLISDGNNNKGRSLGDIIAFAQTINSSINTIDLQTAKNDARVKIEGPSDVIVETQSPYYITVDVVGDATYTLTVTLDGKEELSVQGRESATYNVTLSMREGQHRLEAEIQADDYYTKNNRYYKSIKALPKPRILMISKGRSPLSILLGQVYEVERKSSLPADISEFHAIVFDNLPESQFERKTIDKISSFLMESKGTLFVGGQESFDYGKYRGSLIETLLPVKVGYGTQQDDIDERNINIVILIDISASQGFAYAQGKDVKALDVGKANAIQIVEDLYAKDNVGVVAFNMIPFIISDMSPIEFKRDKVISDIQSLVDGGNTNIRTAMDAAINMIKNEKGSKNIILITDGVDPNIYYGQAQEIAKGAAREGIRVYTVGLGEQTYSKDLRQMAESTGGYFYQPQDLEKFKILFGKPEEDELSALMVEVLNSQHFITQNLEPKALLSGYNQVVPKKGGQMLVATRQGNPVLTVGRVGLGRVAALSTDNGEYWSGELLSKENSKLLTRTINWLVGSSTEEGELRLKIADAHELERVEVLIYANATPQLEGKAVAKVENGLYRTYLNATDAGWHEYLSSTYAINYPEELAELGMSRPFVDYIQSVGGKSFNVTDADSIIDKIKQDSKRVVIDKHHVRWPFIIIAVIIYLVEIGIRRYAEYTRQPAPKFQMKET